MVSGTERTMKSVEPNVSLDHRTRSLEDVRSITLEKFVEEIGPVLLHENGDLCASAQSCLNLRPLVLKVGCESCTIDQGSVRNGDDPSGAVLEAETGALSDLFNGVQSTYGLVFGGGGRVTQGRLQEVLAWDHVLQAMLEGRPLYEPGTLRFCSRDGSPLDLHRTFSPDDDDRDIATFIEQTGFCHLRGWVDPGILDLVANEVLEAGRLSNPGDPNRWWATLEDGTERCVRVMYLLDSSPHMAELVNGEPYKRLGDLFDDGHRIQLDRPQACEALIKPVGTASGLSEFPWHRDCSMGGHAYHCAGYAIGLPLSATGGSDGFLRVVAGSNRASVPSPGLIEGFDSDLPVIAIETEPGDLTIHVGCTLHGTKPPRVRERSVTYTTYSLPATEAGR